MAIQGSNLAGINSVLSSNSRTSTTSASSQGLGRDDFLKLLMTQMQNQNPLDPVKDTDFIAQLSQFSTLDGIQQLNSNFSSLLLLQGLTQGSQLIGSTIAYDNGQSGGLASGQVEAVKVQNGQVNLQVRGTAISLQQVRSVLSNSTQVNRP